jgi:hypothetical protein
MDDKDLIKMLEKKRTERKKSRTIRSVKPPVSLGTPASRSEAARRDRVIKRQRQAIDASDARAAERWREIHLAHAEKRAAFAREKVAKAKAETEMRERSEKARAEQQAARVKHILDNDFDQDVDPQDRTYDHILYPDDDADKDKFKNLRF